MTGFRDIQQLLDKLLAGGKPNHGAFWRGITRDEFVVKKVYGRQIVTVDDAVGSTLVKALRGKPPFGSDLTPRPPGAVMPRMPAGLPPATEAEIQIVEAWITVGCPEANAGVLPMADAGMPEATAEAVVSDTTHIEFWREMDHFFHPQHASDETNEHVGNMMAALDQWVEGFLGGNPAAWIAGINRPDIRAGFNYVRKHQRRLLVEFYGASTPAILDSLWKFGANALPPDPQSLQRPQHTMNGKVDWVNWAPYLTASLEATDAVDMDFALARGWQTGIIADGLLRMDADRNTPAKRVPIPDFTAGPQLRAQAEAAFGTSGAQALITKMIERSTAVLG